MHCFARLPVCFVRGEGARLWDTEGKEYLDFLAGIAVCALGHCHPRVTEAIREQAGRLVHTSNLYYNAEQARLAQLLGELSGGYKAFFGNSGAEANEGAIKLARKWGKLNRGPECVTIFTALNSFHGRTLLTVSATGQEKVKKNFDPLMPGFVHVPLNDLAALEAAVDENTLAVMLELVQGESGIHPCDPEYVKAVRRLCDERKMLLILDEVQCGLGRTGAFFAWQRYGVTPDIFTLAKPIANGVPMGVVMARPGVAEAFQPGDHGSTFGGTHLACAAATAVLETMRDERLPERAEEMGRYFMGRLNALREKHAKIKEVRGLGLMVGMELQVPEAKAVMLRCLENGLVINATGDTVLRFLPPLIVTRDEIDRAVEILDDSL
ncbi:MAG TPA: aspartate aminotransferase family protein [Armatimonadota bacterium]|nr:aspartate aminotransferase family protein [Armatimonadota bacterium]HOJ20806.1 aspartate aminotransferase family protein [Armatimonadota bacterium]HOM82430.1 aspartate aminotransferase family protein [Armatimonadota bacterium]HPO71248.1 aspartate aminotransferase family protein [Armatimonadota bacterium]HPT97599.1 aspartate aminotransferase family protein [Armatimonadota bacterium]